MWKALYGRLLTSQGYELVRPAEEKIDAALDRTEMDLIIKLPVGYRAFIHQFGPGEIGGYFRIYGPKIVGFKDYGNDILQENADWRHPEGFWATTAKPEVVARLICFSTTIGGDACFWDPADVVDSKKHEYGIYVLSHGSHDANVKKAAATFKEFVERHCLANDFKKIVGGHGWDDEGGLPPQQFSPAWKMKKTRKQS